MAVLWTFGLLLDVKEDEDLVRFENSIIPKIVLGMAVLDIWSSTWT